MTDEEAREQVGKEEARRDALRASLDELDERIKRAQSRSAKDGFRSEWTHQQVEYVQTIKAIENIKKLLPKGD